MLENTIPAGHRGDSMSDSPAGCRQLPERSGAPRAHMPGLQARANPATCAPDRSEACGTLASHPADWSKRGSRLGCRVVTSDALLGAEVDDTAGGCRFKAAR